MISSTRVHDVDQSLYTQTLNETRQFLQQALACAQRPIVSTKFNPRTGVLLHLLSRLSPGIPVVWVDTGYNTRDTQKFACYLESSLSLNLHVYRPQDHQITVPPELDSAEHDEFVQTVKLAPFQRALEELAPDVWFTAIRQDQGAYRQSVKERESIYPGLDKLAPLRHWSPDFMDHYLATHGLSMGPECYDPTKGEPMRECGLHTRLWSDNQPVARSA